MPLEYWDQVRGRWLLYRSQGEHSADCERYPYEAIPQRIFLDTNVINLIVKQQRHIFEQEPIPDSLEAETALDTEAIMHLFATGFRASWQMVASDKSIEEIEQTGNPHVREELLSYAIEVVSSDRDDLVRANEFGRRLARSTMIAALPDNADRELIGNAISLRCDVFCTRDNKTILKKRAALPDLPLRILTPREWWAHFKPWAGLWL